MKNFLLKHHLICLGIAFVLIFGICSFFAVQFGKTYIVYLDYDTSKQLVDSEIEIDDPDVIECLDMTTENGEEQNTIKAVFRSKTAGSSRVAVVAHLTGPAASKETKVRQLDMTVNDWGLIFTGVGLSNFSGLPIYYFAVAVFALLMVVYYTWIFIHTLKTTPYSYRSVTTCATAVFFLIVFVGYTIVFMLGMKYLHILDSVLLSQLTENIMGAIIAGSTPFVTVFALLIGISNIALMRHEGIRPANALGIAAGVCMILGSVFISGLLYLNLSQMMSNTAMKIAYSIFASLWVVFDVLLIGSMISGLYAAKHEPAFNKDYIIVLGCGIRKDGTLYPLIQGRVDRAIDFYYDQLEATGKKAVFVPSGGQGGDEPISEAEAMRRYLLSKDIPEDAILPETKSTTTLENMKFSAELIKTHNEKAEIAFSTTNYHVFRSGIFAAQAELDAEGMGSKTKWYFWPNAFLREVAGLFAAQPRKQLLLMALIVLLAGLAGYGYTLIA